MRVLVLGAGGPAANNVVRSLSHNHTVYGVDIDPLMLHRSDASMVCPLTWEDKVEEINAIITGYGIDAVWAQPTAEVQWLAEHREEIGAATFLPHLDTILNANDKLRTAERLSSIAPRSAELTIDNLRDYLRRYDEVWLRMRWGAGAAGALPVRSASLAYEWVDHWYDTAGVGYGEWMISRKLSGRDLSWTGIYSEGHLVISSAKERILGLGADRSPAKVSSTATAQTVIKRLDVNAVAERAIELMAGPTAHGVFMVDMREDSVGHPKVTEINAGRFGTTSDMFVECGPNLPEIAIELATGTYGGDLGRRDEHEVGSLWLRNIDQAGRLLSRGDAETPPTAPWSESL